MKTEKNYRYDGQKVTSNADVIKAASRREWEPSETVKAVRKKKNRYNHKAHLDRMIAADALLLEAELKIREAIHLHSIVASGDATALCSGRLNHATIAILANELDEHRKSLKSTFDPSADL